MPNVWEELYENAQMKKKGRKTLVVKNGHVQVRFRLKPETYEALEKIAVQEDRTLNMTIEWLLKRGIASL